jgi:hypothetical protein
MRFSEALQTRKDLIDKNKEKNIFMFYLKCFLKI